MDVYYLILMRMHVNLGLLFKCNTLRINMLSGPKKRLWDPRWTVMSQLPKSSW